MVQGEKMKKIDFSYWDKQSLEAVVYKLKEFDESSKKFINYHIGKFGRKAAYRKYYNSPLWKIFCRPLLIIIGFELGKLEKRYYPDTNKFKYRCECYHEVKWKGIRPHHKIYDTSPGAFFNAPYNIEYCCNPCHQKKHKKVFVKGIRKYRNI